MSDFFTFGPTGHGVAVDASGRVVAHDGRATGSYVFGYGDTGRPLLVDDQGRLLISIQSASGVTLPDPSLYNFGDKFYITGSGATNLGFYIRGISNWEATTTVLASGEVNTASNLAGGVGLYASKVGDDLRFKSLLAGSGIKLTAATNTVRIDVDEAIDTPITDAGGYYSSDNIEDALQTAGLKNKNFSDASGVMVAATAAAQAKADGVRTDFDNASGVMNDAIALATQNTLDFTNSSGIMTDGIAAATQNTTDFVNSSGVMAAGISAATQNTTDFTNSSGLFAKTSTVTANQKNFTDASGLWVKSLASAGGMTLLKTGTAPSLSIKGLTAISGLGLKAGTNDITIGLRIPSGQFHPTFASNFADMYYHEVSGFMMKGQDDWEQITTNRPHWAKYWIDTTPLPGVLLSLPDANVWHILNYTEASGDKASGGHGLVPTSSGISLLDDGSGGIYTINLHSSFAGSANTVIYVAVFDRENRIRSSAISRKLGATGDVGNVGSTTVYSLNKDSRINVRFMTTGSSKSVNIETLSLNLFRIEKEHR